MNRLGQAVSPKVLLDMIGEVKGTDAPLTIDGAPQISFKEYAEHMGRRWAKPTESGEEYMQRIFAIIDRDKDGKISQQDIEKFVSLWGSDWADMHKELAEEVMEYSDRDKDGVIQYTDFVRVLQRASRASRASRSSADQWGARRSTDSAAH